MKKLYIYITMLGILFSVYSCNDEWEDELYTQMISLKAPIHWWDDASVLYLRYKPQGEVIYRLPVVVSGSKTNEKDFYVKLGVDNDTLSILNEAKFSHRTDLYYHQLPEAFFEFTSDHCHIPSGTDVGLFDIKFYLSELDLVEKWVLPIMIKDDPSYDSNMYKGRRKALLWIIPFNDYSGYYSSTGMNIYFGDETTPMVVGSREARVVDENSIFFYAGNTEEKLEERGQYKIIVTFNNPHQNEDGSLEGSLDVRADKNDINFRLLSNPTYKIEEKMDEVQPHLKHRYVTLNIKYSYDDITSSVQSLPYRCEGSMILERKINVLVPDEDQAIEW